MVETELAYPTNTQAMPRRGADTHVLEGWAGLLRRRLRLCMCVRACDRKTHRGRVTTQTTFVVQHTIWCGGGG